MVAHFEKCIWQHVIFHAFPQSYVKHAYGVRNKLFCIR